MNHNYIDACYLPVFNKIEELLKKDKPSIVAIDGMCGSGKSYLADLLVGAYECNVFHMDNFFLPLEMRTQDRLAKPGGNVHYERFLDEVLTALVNNQIITYQPYICGLWSYGEPIEIEPKKLNIIEGSYCLHPQLRELYDLTVFLEVEEKEQLERILTRSGEDKLQDFIDKWIPLENYYFSQLNIKSISNITIDTSQSGK